MTKWYEDKEKTISEEQQDDMATIGLFMDNLIGYLKDANRNMSKDNLKRVKDSCENLATEIDEYLFEYENESEVD